jgi:hypothetical protein
LHYVSKNAVLTRLVHVQKQPTTALRILQKLKAQWLKCVTFDVVVGLLDVAVVLSLLGAVLVVAGVVPPLLYQHTKYSGLL